MSKWTRAQVEPGRSAPGPKWAQAQLGQGQSSLRSSFVGPGPSGPAEVDLTQVGPAVWAQPKWARPKWAQMGPSIRAWRANQGLIGYMCGDQAIRAQMGPDGLGQPEPDWLLVCQSGH